MYEVLLSEATSLDIDVQERTMTNNIKGLYGDKVIWINKNIDSTAEKICVLAEEIGHFHTTYGDILDQSKVLNIKQEKLARAWAYRRLVPLESLVSALKKGFSTRYEFAESLNVTEQFLEECINYYQSKYGIWVKVDDKHTLRLNPLTLYENLGGNI